VMMLINDATLSLGAILGLLALVGLAARFAVLLVSTVQSIAESVGDQDIGLAVQQAARQRLRPVIVSSAAVAGFVLPMAVLGGRPGLEILQPMALVLLGGLATTAVVSLLVLPALYGPFSSPRPVAPTSSPELATAVGPGGKGGTGAVSGSGNGLHTTQPTSVGSADEGVS
jgi:Cu/Ag efflux pump CusA